MIAGSFPLTYPPHDSRSDDDDANHNDDDHALPRFFENTPMNGFRKHPHERGASHTGLAPLGASKASFAPEASAPNGKGSGTAR
jgi:hypothetical protein